MANLSSLLNPTLDSDAAGERKAQLRNGSAAEMHDDDVKTLRPGHGQRLRSLRERGTMASMRSPLVPVVADSSGVRG